MNPHMNNTPPYAPQPPYVQPMMQSMPPAPPPPSDEEEERHLTRGAITALAAIVGIVACVIGIVIGWLFSSLLGVGGGSGEKTPPTAVTEGTTATTEMHTVSNKHVGTWEANAVVDGKRSQWTISVKNLPMETVMFSLFRDGEAVFDGMTASLVGNGAMFGVLDATSGKTQTGMLLFEEDAVRVRVMTEWSDQGEILWEVLFNDRADPNPQWTAATTDAPLVKPERYASRYWYNTNDPNGLELAIHKADYISVEFSLWDDGRLVIHRGEALWINPNTAEFLYHDGDGTLQGRLVFESQRIIASVDVSTSHLYDPMSCTLNSSSAQPNGRYPTTTTTAVTTTAKTTTTVKAPLPANKQTIEKPSGEWTVRYPEYERGENGEYTITDVKLERTNETQVQISYRFCFTNGVQQSYAVYRFLDANGALLQQTQTALNVQLGQTYTQREVHTLPVGTACIEFYFSR